jgi:hypothetical protein
VLDPSWQSPYVPSSAERHAHQRAVRRFAMRRAVPWIVALSAALVAALVVSAFTTPWLAVAALIAAAGGGWLITRSVLGTEHQGRALAETLLATFSPAGDEHAAQRLATIVDRLTASFGVDGMRARIVAEPGYNAALAPAASGALLVVSDALVADFELIELEGVIAHLLARHRLGVLGRLSLASVAGGSDEARRQLAGPGTTFRADEVAAATIRYPLGIAAALRRCAAQTPPAGSYFATDAYRQARWVWFDVAAERTVAELSDLDDPTLRAMALEEW